MADVRDGLGPYLSIYLKGGQQRQPGRIGVAMAASSIAAVFQIPAGLLVDRLKAERLLVAASGSGVAVGCLLIVVYPAFFAVVAAQILIGAASAIIPPALAALSLGLAGREKSMRGSAATKVSTTAPTSLPRRWQGGAWANISATTEFSISCARSRQPRPRWST